MELGFAGAGNLARGHALGEQLVLMHDDVQAEAGWLAALVASAERQPRPV